MNWENLQDKVLITSQEIFKLLGVEESVVAVHRWVKALHPRENPVMAGKPIVGGFSTGDVNYEKIVEIASQTPGEDVVITYQSPWADNIENHLDGMDGIKTLKLSTNKMEHFTEQCRLLATVVGREKDEILSAGLQVSSYINVDDTGARHKGKNGYCTYIGNELFSWFDSTDSKSRISFLKYMQAGRSDFYLNMDALTYMQVTKLPKKGFSR